MSLILFLYLDVAWWQINRNSRANAGEHLHWMVATLRSGLEETRSRALAQAELIAMAPMVVRFFSQDDRAGLLGGCSPVFALQRKKYGLDQLNFYRPDGQVFLRVQAPSNLAGPLEPNRSVLGAVSRRQEPQSAVEISRTGPAIFGMAPVVQGPRLIGVAAVGMQFQPLVEKLHRDFGVDAAAIVDERRLRETVTDYRAAASQDLVGGFSRIAATDWPLCQALLTGARLAGLHEPLTWLGSAEHGVYGVAVVPMRDTSDALVGHLMAVRDLEQIGTRVRRTRVVSVVVTLFAMVLVAGAVAIVFNGMLLRPVQDLVARMQATQRGESAPPAEPHLLSRPDEVGDLARIYEAMR